MIRFAPTFEGKFGKAWEVKKPDDGPDAGIVAYQVNRPGAHPWWEWWVVSVVSLRDIDGIPVARKSYPEATHEFVIASLSPDDPVPMPDDPAPKYCYLTPIDVVHQFHGLDDGQAKDLCAAAIKAIVIAGISPDQDFRAFWKNLLTNTIQHIALGGHPKAKA